MSKDQPLIFNIQRFSTHDGPGIRTTIFFKGCPLRCLWCHNPESQSFEKEDMINEKGVISKVGQTYSIEEIVDIVKKDQLYYDNSGGGVTLSGGEVMSQNIDYIEELIVSIKKWGIEIAIDTSGFTSKKNIERLLPYVDLWLYDLKFLDNGKHKYFVGQSNEEILENLKVLSEADANISLRMIIIGGLNDTVDYAKEVASYLKDKSIKVNKIDLLPYHNFGRNKYSQLNRDCTQNFDEPSQESLREIKQFLSESKYEVSIGG